MNNEEILQKISAITKQLREIIHQLNDVYVEFAPEHIVPSTPGGLPDRCFKDIPPLEASSEVITAFRAKVDNINIIYCQKRMKEWPAAINELSIEIEQLKIQLKRLKEE